MMFTLIRNCYERRGGGRNNYEHDAAPQARDWAHVCIRFVEHIRPSEKEREKWTVAPFRMLRVTQSGAIIITYGPSCSNGLTRKESGVEKTLKSWWKPGSFSKHDNERLRRFHNLHSQYKLRKPCDSNSAFHFSFINFVLTFFWLLKMILLAETTKKQLIPYKWIDQPPINQSINHQSINRPTTNQSID